MSDFSEVKDRMKFVWAQGDYPTIAGFLMPAAEALVEACGVQPGMQVLDVAAGDGNVAVAAARRGASVIATDLTPELVEKGKERTQAEGLDIQWREADAEDLPFDNDQFDIVTSAFGAMFAPRADHTAGELVRVAKPGGKIGFTAWVADGFIGQSFAMGAKYMPPPPEGADTAVSWGEEATAQDRFSKHASAVEIERGIIPWRFASLDEWVEVNRTKTPPAVVAQMLLPPETYAEYAQESLEHVKRSNKATDGSVDIDAEYLMVVATK